ncbi:hypothetical protein [Pedobacter sp. SYSU D00535]|uniref:hypothetical protein n=1 Tax=Pedobacter sp. SYSU D00535 TaxID=2810308 RepID=UPI001A97A1E4|nr:hypothetical protein [Pedobacter sp. SYSU D00535]
MIDFLKESTFAVNEVINKSWVVLYKNYKNIAGLCLTMFLLLWMSTFLSSFTDKGVSFFNILAILGFIVLYLGLQLTLFKYILHAINFEDNNEEGFVQIFATFVRSKWKQIVTIVVVPLLFLVFMSFISALFGINQVIFTLLAVFLGLLFVVIRLWNQIKPFFSMMKDYWPTKTQFRRFLVAFITSMAAFFLIIMLIGALFFPFVLLGMPMEKIVPIALGMGVVLGLIVLIRISFFPFFILDQECNTFRSLRFSLAVTRGNFTRILILMALIVVCQLVAGYLQAKEYYLLSLAISLIYSFIIVPLSSVIIGVAYYQMMSEYTGDEDPDIMDNII